MGKTKISGRPKAFSRNMISKKRKRSTLEEYDPTLAILDEDRIGRVIWECLKDGDSEGVIEAIQIYLESIFQRLSVL